MKRFLLPLIILTAFLFRFIDLTDFPSGFNADEASFGYDAYSLMTTGKDQWGNSYPLVLKSFGDYKSPLYSYLTVPSIKIFGLTKMATRLPNVIIGTLSVLVLYLLVKEMVNEKWLMVNKSKINHHPSIIMHLPLVASLLIAISPWHIMLSRGAFEANLSVFFLPFGVYLFLKGLKNHRLFILSAIIFGLNLFTYHSAKLVTPMVLTGLVFVFWQRLKKVEFRKMIPAILVFSVFFIGLVYTFKIGGGGRIAERSILSGALEQGAEVKIRLINEGVNPVIARLLHNKYQVVAQRFTTNYFQYFSAKFFLTQGAADSYYGMIPGIGTVHFFELILLVGVFYLLFKKETRFPVLILLVWLVIAPLPAALSTGAGYSGTRAVGMLPVIQIMAAFGFYGWVLLLGKLDKKILSVVAIVFVLVAVVEVRSFSSKYFQHPDNSVSRSMLLGSLEVFEWLRENKGSKSVIVSRSLSEPQIFVAFAGPWDPSEYQKQTAAWGFDETGLKWVDQMGEWRLGEYTFKSVEWEVDSKIPETLIVARPDELPDNIVPVETFYYRDGTSNIIVVDPGKKFYAKAN
jgi:4-amino-4-deoxy-L-arabinose transferase-like glycosyltransferase